MTEPPPQRAATRRLHKAYPGGGGAEVEPGGDGGPGPCGANETGAHQGGAERRQRREVTLGKLLWREVTLAGPRRRGVTLAGPRRRGVTLAGPRRRGVTLAGPRRRG